MLSVLMQVKVSFLLYLRFTTPHPAGFHVAKVHHLPAPPEFFVLIAPRRGDTMNNPRSGAVAEGN